MQESGALAQIEGFINSHFGLSIHISTLKPRMVFSKVICYTQNTADPTKLVVSSTYRVAVSIQVGTFEVSATFTPSGLDFKFSDLQNTIPSTSIIDRLGAAVLSSAGALSGNPSSNDLPNPGGSGAFNSLLKSVDLWYLSIDRTSTGETSNGDPIYGPTFWSIGILGVWPTNNPAQPLLIGLFWLVSSRHLLLDPEGIFEAIDVIFQDHVAADSCSQQSMPPLMVRKAKLPILGDESNQFQHPLTFNCSPGDFQVELGVA